MEEIKITLQGAEVIASPFKKTNPKEDKNRYSNLKDITNLKDIKGIQQQNNYTNKILGTISSQLDIIEKNFPKSKESKHEKPLFKISNPHNIINLLNYETIIMTSLKY